MRHLIALGAPLLILVLLVIGLCMTNRKSVRIQERLDREAAATSSE